MLSNSLGFSINYGEYLMLTTEVGFFGEFRLLALISGVGCARLFNFAASTLFVYSDKRQ